MGILNLSSTNPSLVLFILKSIPLRPPSLSHATSTKYLPNFQQRTSSTRIPTQPPQLKTPSFIINSTPFSPGLNTMYTLIPITGLFWAGVGAWSGFWYIWDFPILTNLLLCLPHPYSHYSTSTTKPKPSHSYPQLVQSAPIDNNLMIIVSL